MAITAAVDNASETSGDLNKEAWDKYNLLRSAVLVDHDTDGTHLSTGTVVLKALFDANTILAADSDDTPAALTVAASRIIGRASTGNIAALTAAQVNTILSTATKALDNLTAVAINTSLISDTDNTDDLGSAAKEWKDLYIDGTANIDSLVADTADINGGTVDGITSLTAGGNLDLGAYTFTCAGLIDDTLTSGRVVFASTGGLLADDTDFTFATDTLTVTKIGAFEATGAINFASQNMTNVDIDSGTIDGISALTSSGNLDIGAHGFTANTLTADGLTATRVVYAGSGGLLSGDADMTFSTDTLTVKKLVLNDATTATTDMLTLTPAGAVATDAIWKGIYVNGDALDPSGANAAIESIYVDLSGVAAATGLEIRGAYISVPAGLGYEAVHSIGKIKLDNDESTLAAGETATGIDIIVSASAAGGGEYHAIDVATTGTSSATLAALGTHTGIDVIHQHTGSFIAPTQAWTYDDSGSSYGEVTTAFGSAGTDVTIFDEDDDAIFVGADAAFDEIEVILATAASVDIKPTFWYSKAASFTRFFPADDTEGFTQDGIIRFVGSDLTDFAAQSVNGTSKFYIKIVRTKNNVTTDPIEDTIKTLAATECFWNSTGAVQIVSLGAFQATGAIDFNDQNMTSVDIDSGTIGGVTLDGAIAGGDQAFTGVGDMTFTAGSLLKSGATGADTLLLAANDTTFITLTTGTPDTLGIGAFTLSGKLTGGASEIESSAFDIDGGDISAATISGGLTWSAAQNLGAYSHYINDTANAKMTYGLTINQGAADDEIFAGKSSDVNHGVTGEAETDTFCSFGKVAADGGLSIRGIATTGVTAFRFQGLYPTDDVTKTIAGAGAFQAFVAKTSGTAIAACGANANLFSVTGYTSTPAWETQFIVDIEGDLFANGGVGSTNMVTLYDDYEDAELVRAFDIARADRAGIVTDQWKKFVQYNEDTLVELGILGDRLENGGLTNVTRLQQLHNGAIWQNHCKFRQLNERTERLENKLLALEMK